MSELAERVARAADRLEADCYLENFANMEWRCSWCEAPPARDVDDYVHHSECPVIELREALAEYRGET